MFLPAIKAKTNKNLTLKKITNIKQTGRLIFVLCSQGHTSMTVGTKSPVNQTNLNGRGPCQPPLTSYYAHDP